MARRERLRAHTQQDRVAKNSFWTNYADDVAKDVAETFHHPYYNQAPGHDLMLNDLQPASRPGFSSYKTSKHSAGPEANALEIGPGSRRTADQATTKYRGLDGSLREENIQLVLGEGIEPPGQKTG